MTTGEKTSVSAKRRIAIALTLVIVVGAFFRVFHADWKIYSDDETITSLRASGHTYAEYERFIHDGKPQKLSDLAPFEGVDRSRGMGDVWETLAAEDPQHPPFYFLVTHLTEKALGESIFVRRFPAIMFGILAVAAGWWLAIELFGDALVALFFTTLLSIAPFHVIYSQDAREYSLWTLLTCASSALLLRVFRTGCPLLFVPYALAVSMGLWNFTFFAFVMIAHGIYSLLPQVRARRSTRFWSIAALGVGAVSFLPWVDVLAHRYGIVATDTSWGSGPLSLPLYAGKWVFNATTMFFDLDYVTLLLLPISLALLVIAATCCWLFARTAPIRVRLFVALLGGVNTVALLIPDIFFHQTRAVASRYMIPLWLAVELATAFGLVSFCRSERPFTRKAWRTAAIALFASGAVSCTVDAFAHSWWIADNDKAIPAIAAALSRQTNPTLVYVDDDQELLELAASMKRSIAYRLHSSLDDQALKSAKYPFVLARNSVVAQSAVADRLRAVELPKLFPSGTDPVVVMLRQRAARERHLQAAGNDLTLFEVFGGPDAASSAPRKASRD